MLRWKESSPGEILGSAAGGQRERLAKCWMNGRRASNLTMYAQWRSVEDYQAGIYTGAAAEA